MQQLSQIFSQTIAPSTVKRKQAKENDEARSDALTDAYLPTDQVDLRSAPPSNPFQPAKFAALNNTTAGLPSLSRSYSSHSGGMLDIVG